ncbi:MAG: hypothetical protein AAGI17_03670 [Planctomycetota bacterium]
MESIDRVLAAAARRLAINALLRTLTWALTAALVVGLALVLVEKLTPSSMPWKVLALIGLGASAASALVWVLVTRPRGVDLADEVDRRADLRETLSTAVVVSKQGDGWSKAVVQSAGERARRVVLRDAVPIEAPRLWWAPLALVLVVGGLMLAPKYDVTGLIAKQAEKEQAEEQVKQVKLEIQENKQELEKVLERAGIEQPEEGDGPGDNDPTRDDEIERPEEIQRREIARLTKVADELRKQADGQQAKQLEAMQRSLQNLKTPQGPMAEFGRSLARGNFSKARQALENLAEQAQSGELSAEEKAELQRNLEQMKKQFEQLANSQSELQQQLQQAGLSEQQAQQLGQNPQALQEALQQAGVPAAQAQQMAQQAAAQQTAMEAMQGMAGAMGQMAQAMQQGEGAGGQQQQQMNQGLDQAAQQMGAMEQMAGEMAAINEAMQMVQAQMQGMQPGGMPGQMPGQGNGNSPGNGQIGQFQQGQSQMSNAGSGGAGRGESGSGPGSVDAPFVLQKQKANVRTEEGGPIIASTLIYGQQVRGESQQTFAQTAAASSQQATEAVETMRVPRELHDAVKHYFGRLEAIANKQDAGEGQSAPPPPANGGDDN